VISTDDSIFVHPDDVARSYPGMRSAGQFSGDSGSKIEANNENEMKTEETSPDQANDIIL